MQAAVEWMRPIGATVYYGLLAARFIPDTTSTATIEVEAEDLRDRPFLGSLVSKIDSVHVGLPNEYADAVLRGAVASFRRLNDRPGGTLRFCEAAHGEVGSSNTHFQGLAGIVVQVLLTCTVSTTDSQLASLFEVEAMGAFSA